MSQLAINIIGSVVAAIILAWLGFGGSTRVTVSGGGRVRKTGKWIMIIAVILIFVGLNWAGKNPSNTNQMAPGYGLVIFSIFLFFIGKVIAWFQRN